MALERKMLRDQIKELVMERILNGTYEPGERIVETQLMTELGTSQAPVREALRDLEALRFIESIPYRGARVRLVTSKELADTYPVRASLEELAGRMVADHVDAALLDALQVELDAMRKFARAGDIVQQLSHDVRFHELIVEATANGVLVESWRALRVEARTLVSVIKGNHDLLEVADMHQVILDSLRTGDGSLVGKEMRRHIEFFAESIDKLGS